jgi:hypothetical protein
MKELRYRLRERTLDALDWVDYRRDAHWWQYLVLALTVVGAIWFVPGQMGIFILGAALGVTVVVGALALLVWWMSVWLSAVLQVVDVAGRNRA